MATITLVLSPFAPTDERLQASNFVSEHLLLNSFVKSAIIRTLARSRFMKRHAMSAEAINTTSWIISCCLMLRSSGCAKGHSVTI